jgi:hypothetical protein
MSSETPEPAAEAEAAPETVEGEEVSSPESEDPQWIELPPGEALSYEEAGETMKVAPTKVILVAGEDDSGKTSLLCGVYEQFSNGDFAGHLFCGSRTLRAFERRSFLQRAESGLKTPDTERTRLAVGQLALLHLELQAKGSGERVGLLATDLAGEAFRFIRNDPRECERYPVLGRIDCVTLLLDCERLIDRNERHGHVNSTRTILRSLLQSGTLRTGVPVILALSKWDLIEGAAARKQADKDAREVLAAAGESPTEVLKIAAAPVKAGSSVQAGYGLASLLDKWLDANPPAAAIPGVESAEAPARATSAFDLFQGKA